MSRTFSSGFRTSLKSAQTNEAYVVLVEIDHPNLSQPLRINDSGQLVTSNGHDYAFLPFGLVLPDDQEQQSPKAQLVVTNTDRQIMEAVLAMGGTPATCTFSIVKGSTPDTIEAQWPDFTLSGFSINVHTVTAVLSIEDFSNEPWPSGTFNQGDFPGLFG